MKKVDNDILEHNWYTKHNTKTLKSLLSANILHEAVYKHMGYIVIYNFKHIIST